GERYGERTLRGFSIGGVRVGEIRIAAVAVGDFEPHAGRAVREEMRAHLRENVSGALARHEAEGEFHERLARDDGLAAGALETAADAVHLGGRACPCAF